jgi:hypothetical protein
MNKKKINKGIQREHELQWSHQSRHHKAKWSHVEERKKGDKN